MKLFLARHAETNENRLGIVQGHYDSLLSYVGVKQALFLSHRLEHELLDVIVTSDLRRCVDTAQMVRRFHHVPVVVSPLLREQSRGVYERQERQIVNDIVASSGMDYPYWRPEGGESLEDVWYRVVPFFERLHDEFSSQNMLLVSHGGTLACLLAYLDGKGLDAWASYKSGNTAVSIANVNGRGSSLELLNCSTHLG